MKLKIRGFLDRGIEIKYSSFMRQKIELEKKGPSPSRIVCTVHTDTYMLWKTTFTEPCHWIYICMY